MPSALRPAGSTSQWRKLRACYAAALASHLQPCPICGRIVYSWQQWDLHHVTPRAQGGTDDWRNLRPAHRACNQRTDNHPPARRTLPPSRDW